MTLCTRIFIHEPVDPHELFTYMQKLLSILNPEIKQTSHKGEMQNGNKLLGNDIGQGLSAILEVEYRPGGKLYTQEQAQACDGDCEEYGCESPNAHTYNQDCWVELSLDTAYGWKQYGMTCTDLHVAYMSALNLWLHERGGTWTWRNEYSGQINNAMEGFDDFAQGGIRAQEWFSQLFTEKTLS